MKSSFVAFAALVGAVAAQNLDDLPECGRTCVNNMLAESKASELGCDANDQGCLCLNPNFTYGVRDCSRAICDGDDVEKIVDFAINWCSNAGVAITTDGGSASASSTGEGDGVVTTTAVETVTGTISTIFSDSTPIGTTIIGGGIGGIGGDASSAVSSAAGAASSAVGGFVTTISSGGSEIVQTITSGLAEASSRASDVAASISSEAGDVAASASDVAASLSSEASDVAASASSRVSDILNSGSSFLSSILPTPTPSGDGNGDGNSDGNGDGSDPETSSSDGAAVPQKTAAPLGIIAAAGLAAILL